MKLTTDKNKKEKTLLHKQSLIWFLQICKTWFTSQTDATQHYAGKKHIRAANGGRRARYRDVYLSHIILRKIAVSAEIVIPERWILQAVEEVAKSKSVQSNRSLRPIRDRNGFSGGSAIYTGTAGSTWRYQYGTCASNRPHLHTTSLSDAVALRSVRSFG